MNTKFQLFIIVIIAIFSLSSSLTYPLGFNTETVVSRVHSKSGNESRAGAKANQAQEQSNPATAVAPPIDDVTDFKGMNGDDDGVEHHFHFGRVRKCRKYARVLCIVAKAVLIVTHFALLVFCYCHLVHH